MSEWYDLEGNPIDMEQWAALMETKHRSRRTAEDGWSTPDEDPTRVAIDRIGNVRVSTVWLGLNHNWGDGPPLIFETTVFGGTWDQWQERYSTKEQALKGHHRVCEAIRAGEEPPWVG